MPGRVALADAGDVGEAGEQAVDQRAVAVAGARVHDQPGRLVDHDDGVVDVDDPELDAGVRLRRLDHRDRRRVDLDHARPRSQPHLAAS